MKVRVNIQLLLLCFVLVRLLFNPTIDTQNAAPYHSLPSTGVLKARHCVFKVPMKRGILTYTNAYGEIEQKDC